MGTSYRTGKTCLNCDHDQGYHRGKSGDVPTWEALLYGLLLVRCLVDGCTCDEYVEDMDD